MNREAAISVSQDRWVGSDPLALHVGEQLTWYLSQCLTRLDGEMSSLHDVVNITLNTKKDISRKIGLILLVH